MENIELKPCPFCGAYLEKKIENIRKGLYIRELIYYEHPTNRCILSINTDEFPYIVTEGSIALWNRRAGGDDSESQTRTD